MCPMVVVATAICYPVFLSAILAIKPIMMMLITPIMTLMTTMLLQ